MDMNCRKNLDFLFLFRQIFHHCTVTVTMMFESFGSYCQAILWRDSLTDSLTKIVFQGAVTVLVARTRFVWIWGFFVFLKLLIHVLLPNRAKKKLIYAGQVCKKRDSVESGWVQIFFTKQNRKQAQFSHFSCYTYTVYTWKEPPEEQLLIVILNISCFHRWMAAGRREFSHVPVRGGEVRGALGASGRSPTQTDPHFKPGEAYAVPAAV